MDLSSLKQNIKLYKSNEEKIQYIARELQFENMLNIGYIINHKEKIPFAHIGTLGIPEQLIQIMRKSVNVPLEQLEIPVNEIPLLKQAYSEKRHIYFKKVPELIASLLTRTRLQQQIRNTLITLGITDVAISPVLKGPEKIPSLILVVLGPLTQMQLSYIRNIIDILENDLIT